VLLSQHRPDNPLRSQHKDKSIDQGGKDESRRRGDGWCGKCAATPTTSCWYMENFLCPELTS